MSLTDNNNGMVMPVSPMYGGGNAGFGGYGGYGDGLRTANSNARFDASQNAQTATIQAGQRTLANEIEQYVLPTAKPCYVVQNPNCCGQQTFGCGCSAVA